MNTKEEKKSYAEAFDRGMATIAKYKNVSWRVDGLFVSINGDGVAEPWDDMIRAHAMLAFARVIDSGNYDVLRVDRFSVDAATSEITDADIINDDTLDFEPTLDEPAPRSQDEGYIELGDEDIIECEETPPATLDDKECVAGWLRDNLKERTADLVRESMANWGAAKAIGGEFDLLALSSAARSVARNFESCFLKDLPGTTSAIRGDLTQLLIAEACAEAADRPDLAGSYRTIIESYMYGNPVLGIGRDDQLIVIAE